MTILAVDENPEAVKKLAKNLAVAFPQETIVTFEKSLFALQYVMHHPREIGLLFAAIAMHHVDGIELSRSLQKCSPGAAIFFLVDTDSWELAAIARQHGNGTCLPRPVTVEAIREATGFLNEPCLMEDENCEEGCLWEWCEHKLQKNSV